MRLNLRTLGSATQLTIGGALIFVMPSQAQTVIPQIADGGGWQTTVVLANANTSTASASLSFYQETSGGATQSWSPSFLEGASTQNLSLAGGGTLFLHTPGTAAATSVGWAQIQAGPGVLAYSIFTLRVPGRQDQDGTAPAAASATRFLIPFDNSPGFATSIALANPTAASESVAVSIQTDAGAISHPSLADLPAQGHTAFSLVQQFPETNGHRGLIELYSANGSLSAIALRFNPTGAFTTAPVYAESGSPIIGGTGGGGGTLPAFDTITMTTTFAPDKQPNYALSIGVVGSGGRYLETTASSASVITSPLPPVTGFSTSWTGVSVSGRTFTMSGLILGGSAMVGSDGKIYGITSGSLTVTLNPGAVPESGTVTGTLTLVSAKETLTGPITGTYIASP